MSINSPTHLVPITFEPVVAPKQSIDVHIGLDEHLDEALRRITVGYFDFMIGELSHPEDRDVGVHEARKAMKRVRALLRLVRDEIGYEAYRNENVILRDVARRLAPVRDSAVLVDTLDALTGRYDGVVMSSAFGPTRAFLILRHRRLHNEILDDRQLMADLLISLKAARSRFEGHGALGSAHGGPPIRDDVAAIVGGLTRVHRRGRKGMHRARRLRTNEALHEWRKRVKYLRYQMESLAPLWPELLAAYAGRLDDLGEALGVDHALAVLGEIVTEDTDACTDPRVRAVLLALVGETRAGLQDRAFRLGPTLYDEPTDQFVDRIASFWASTRT